MNIARTSGPSAQALRAPLQALPGASETSSTPSDQVSLGGSGPSAQTPGWVKWGAAGAVACAGAAAAGLPELAGALGGVTVGIAAVTSVNNNQINQVIGDLPVPVQMGAITAGAGLVAASILTTAVAMTNGLQTLPAVAAAIAAGTVGGAAGVTLAHIRSRQG